MLTCRIFLRSSGDEGCCIQESGRDEVSTNIPKLECMLYFELILTRSVLFDAKLAEHLITQAPILDTVSVIGSAVLGVDLLLRVEVVEVLRRHQLKSVVCRFILCMNVHG